MEQHNYVCTQKKNEPNQLLYTMRVHKIVIHDAIALSALTYKYKQVTHQYKLLGRG